MPIAKVNGINIYYELHGKGKPLTLIAGLTEDHQAWENMLDFLTHHDYQVLVLDNRGIGASDAPDESYDLKTMAADTAALLDALNIKQSDFIGYSMGSAICQYLALDYPQKVRRMILGVPFTKIYPASRFLFHVILDFFNYGVAQELTYPMLTPWNFTNNFFADPKKVADLMEEQKKKPFAQSLAGFKKHLQAITSFNSHDWAHQIQAPILIVAGEKDILCPAEDAYLLAEKIPNAKIKMVPLGHSLRFEAPDLFNNFVLEFFEADRA